MVAEKGDRQALMQTVRQEFRWQLETRLHTLIDAGLTRFQLPAAEHSQVLEANYAAHQGDIDRLMSEQVEPPMKNIPTEGLQKTVEGMGRERAFLEQALPGKPAQERMAILDQVQNRFIRQMLPRPEFVTLELGQTPADSKVQFHADRLGDYGRPEQPAPAEAQRPMQGMKPKV